MTELRCWFDDCEIEVVEKCTSISLADYECAKYSCPDHLCQCVNGIREFV